MEDDDIKDHFSQFGKIVNVEQMRWGDTGKKRGFGFVEFDDYDSVDKLVLVSRHEVRGRRLEVKKAMSKLEMSMVKRSKQEDFRGSVSNSRGERRRGDREMGRDENMGNMGMNSMGR